MRITISSDDDDLMTHAVLLFLVTMPTGTSARFNHKSGTDEFTSVYAHGRTWSVSFRPVGLDETKDVPAYNRDRYARTYDNPYDVVLAIDTGSHGPGGKPER
jgi:hypothetical protein